MRIRRWFKNMRSRRRFKESIKKRRKPAPASRRTGGNIDASLRDSASHMNPGSGYGHHSGGYSGGFSDGGGGGSDY